MSLRWLIRTLNAAPAAWLGVGLLGGLVIWFFAVVAASVTL